MKTTLSVVLFSLALSILIGSAPVTAQEVAEYNISVLLDRNTFQCHWREDRVLQCQWGPYRSDVLNSKFPLLSYAKLIVQRTEANRSDVERLQALAETGATLPARLQVSRLPGTIQRVQFRIRPVASPTVVIEGIATDPRDIPKPPYVPCTSDCCNSWCGTGQV